MNGKLQCKILLCWSLFHTCMHTRVHVHVCVWLYRARIENAFLTVGCNQKGLKATILLDQNPVFLFQLSCHSPCPLSFFYLISITPVVGLLLITLQILFLPLGHSPHLVPLTFKLENAYSSIRCSTFGPSSRKLLFSCFPLRTGITLYPNYLVMLSSSWP